ncbi:hypothetical protein [Haloarcula nitratireducens]|uniref:Uncharacterized protein n=1 Tax=Haloarcula nitratireducens TaxID=2487749 RepID=A0AAW4PGP8_9EURY|nr:hypothetical protein [Halomicroarcula nitratireducens]MBX0296803.1 hypothetical protein [Halomicroarcula nitratireducens]
MELTDREELIIGQYLSGEITREEAVEEIGTEMVERVDAARDGIKEDVDWGLRRSGSG